MNRLAAVSFAAFLGLASVGSITLGAQTPTSNPNPAPSPASTAGSSPTVYVAPTSANLDCPVSMRAQHGSGGGLRFTRELRSPDRPGNAQNEIAQRIHLSLGSARGPARVTSARVTVRGTGAKWRTVPTALGMDNSMDSSSDLRKTINITFRPGQSASVDDNEGTSTDMVLAGFTSVQSITLDSLTYADGSIWTSSAGRTCRVIPDPLMLVDNR
jgi:hypothetical protein